MARSTRSSSSAKKKSSSSVASASAEASSPPLRRSSRRNSGGGGNPGSHDLSHGEDDRVVATTTKGPKQASVNNQDDAINDPRGGIKFGTAPALSDDDPYASGLVGGAGLSSKHEYVTELVEEQEEESDNDAQDGASSEVVIDTGRIGAGTSHPSSRAASSRMTDEEIADSQDPFASNKSQLSQLSSSGKVNTTIADRESDYQKRRHQRVIREDGLSFAESMQQANMDKEKDELLRQLASEANEEKNGDEGAGAAADSAPAATDETTGRKRRWDDDSSSAPSGGPLATAYTETTTTDRGPNGGDAAATIVSDTESLASRKAQWEGGGDNESLASSSAAKPRRRKRWDETPVAMPGAATATATSAPDATPVVSRTSKWDETPVVASGSAAASVLATPSAAASSGAAKNRWDATPVSSTGPQDSALPSAGAIGMGKSSALEKEMESRNRPWTEAALDALLPSEGYKIVRPPTGYVPLRTPGRKLLATPTPLSMTPAGFTMEVPIEQREGVSVQEIREAYGVPLAGPLDELTASGSAAAAAAAAANLPHIKEDDVQYFGRLLEDVDEDKLSKEEAKERQIMMLLLKIKSGTPPQRKTAMRQITDKARSFGAGPLFNQILPLLMSPSLEDQERHWLVKVIDRVLYRLDDLVRPYVHRILAVIEPLLIDEDYYARVEGREIISNLAKAAGLATMIATMRPDIDSPDEYVRNTTSRAFAVVASALGVPALLPFLKAVCQSRKSWQARHTGIKIVQQIALLMGVAVLPYLRELVDIISHGLTDDVLKVKIMTALTCAALAEAAHPYGIESFDPVIRPLWKGSMEQHGKSLAAFLKAIGFVILLMEDNYASHYTRLVMPILIREFTSPDEEMKRIVLKVIQQCVSTAGVEPDYIRTEILPEFFKNFWVRRMALDRRNYKQVVETTEELANKVGSSEIVVRIVDDLKDDSEPYRRMVMETIKKVLDNLGASDIDDRLEERLIDGMLYAFQEQAVDVSTTGGSHESEIMLDGFGTVVNALGERCKPYLKQVTGTIKWRLNNKSAPVRMQAADLIGRIAIVMKACGEDQLMGHLGVVLYEYLGEEFPEVLGSILGAIRAIVNVIGMTKMTPPIRDLLPRLTPILRNRHEKVQENVIDLVGRIADRGAEQVSAKEWLRICFELLEMVRAHKRAIRRAAVSTFGFIAKAIGPQDVLHTLLSNLKVQDRQMRVCTTVAIAIVAESCGPFTVLPALMNEYRTPELNVQNGVLKALSFVFEYIGDMGRDYIYAVTPLLEDALMERDPVHRQTACATVKHLALGVAGLGCEDALIHLLNYVWPNIFEESPHVIQAVFDAIQGLTVALGPNVILQYTLQGLYHPARKVRDMYWRIYNMLYIYHADALVMGYPMIADEGDNTYARTTLELFI